MEDFHIKYTVEEYPYDIELLKKFVEVAKHVKKARHDLVDEQVKKYDERAKIDLKWIADFAVDHFYDSRDPFVYKRQESLYKAYKIIVDDGYWDIDTEASNIAGAHHQSNEIIFNNVFLQGFHGGSTGTDKNGDTVSSPTWRTPVPKYTHWGASAAQAPISPEDEIDEEFEKYRIKKKNALQEELDKGDEKIIDELEAAAIALISSIRK